MIDINQKNRVYALLQDMEALVNTNFAWHEIQPFLEKRASELLYEASKIGADIDAPDCSECSLNKAAN